MREFWLPIAAVVLLSGGCSPKSELPRSTPSFSSRKAEKSTTKPHAEPKTKAGEWPAEKVQTGRLFDDFHLPLVIEITPPEVPPEIQGPSPPIKEEPNPP